MGRKGRKPIGEWLPTGGAAEQLGISARRLRDLRDDLSMGKHYLIVSKRNADRPTYLWNIHSIRSYLSTPLEVR
ncbi:hypothetical protein BST81_13835 [Leptolyngbya sp. 'hensonii']|uniref:hypothetical protein n=1 Tax=Leptolyngbya sp. 'hensonii' TaxID=1922337 RepID=UPI00094F7B09|nr:hypothetical protein [Leptolyngbya sp. 'hensonii']OLP18101.1 hypothetical protein BST81_13835 [Leptolyngbya sp. 'hensonii']